MPKQFARGLAHRAVPPSQQHHPANSEGQGIRGKVTSVQRPSDLSPATRRRLTVASYVLGTVLTAATSRVTRAGPATTAIGTIVVADQRSGATSSSTSIEGSLVRYGWPAPVWKVRTPLGGAPQGRLQVDGLIIDWFLYCALASGLLTALRWLHARRAGRVRAA
jgi:hypothetical protein